MSQLPLPRECRPAQRGLSRHYLGLASELRTPPTFCHTLPRCARPSSCKRRDRGAQNRTTFRAQRYSEQHCRSTWESEQHDYFSWEDEYWIPTCTALANWMAFWHISWRLSLGLSWSRLSLRYCLWNGAFLFYFNDYIHSNYKVRS